MCINKNIQAKNKACHSKQRYRNECGNITVLIIGFVVLLIAIALFTMNFGNLFTQYMTGKTGSEAAALQFAMDMGRVVADGPFSRISLVDQVSRNSNERPVMGVNTRQAVIRLDYLIAAELGNTTMAFAANSEWEKLKADIRALDSVLQEDPNSWKDIDNKPINAAANALKAYKVNLRQDKGANYQLVDGTFKWKIGRVTGTNLATSVPVPEPQSVDAFLQANKNKCSSQQGSRRVYTSYQPIGIDVTGKQYSSGNGSGPFPAFRGGNPVFQFVASGQQPALVQNSRFTEEPAFIESTIPLPPSVVQISGEERVKKLEGAEDTKQNVITASTAQVGGFTLATTTGSLCVGFPDGLPLDIGTTAGMFHNVRSMMNWSQAAELKANTPRPDVGWNANSLGHWFKADGGPIGGSNELQAGSFKHEHYFKQRDEHDDPSISISLAVYDWVRGMGLRPNIKTVFNALNMGSPQTDVKAVPNSFLSEMNRQGSGGTTYTAMGINQDIFMPPVYAAGSEDPIASVFQEDPTSGESRISGADHSLMRSSPGSSGDFNDPRLALNHVNGAMDAQQTALAFGDDQHAVVAPKEAVNLAANANEGTITSADGGPLPIVIEYESALARSGNISAKVAEAAKAVEDGAAAAIANQEAMKANAENSKRTLANPPPAEGDAGYTQYQEDSAYNAQQDGVIDAANAEIARQNQVKARALRVKKNAVYVNNTVIKMVENQKLLTGLDLQKKGDKHFSLANSNFWPVSQPSRELCESNLQAVMQMIAGESPMSTGQASNHPDQSKADWTAELNPAEPAGSGESQLVFYKRTASADPQIPQIGSWFQPAHAQSGIPPANKRMFIFTINNDGGIRMFSTPTTPFGTTALLQDQYIYQNTLGLKQTVEEDKELFWLVQLRDQNVDDKGTWFADGNAPGNTVNPKDWCKNSAFGGDSGQFGDNENCFHVISEIRISCPVFVTGCDQIKRTDLDGAVQGEVNPCPPPPPCGS